MRYELTITPRTESDGQVEHPVCGVEVTVIGDDDTAILTGATSVATADPEAVRAYVETVFLPDLRRNYPGLLGGLVLPGDLPPGGEGA